jgi:hypothetical protein
MKRGMRVVMTFLVPMYMRVQPDDGGRRGVVVA